MSQCPGGTPCLNDSMPRGHPVSRCLGVSGGYRVSAPCLSILASGIPDKYKLYAFWHLKCQKRRNLRKSKHSDINQNRLPSTNATTHKDARAQCTVTRLPSTNATTHKDARAQCTMTRLPSTNATTHKDARAQCTVTRLPSTNATTHKDVRNRNKIHTFFFYNEWMDSYFLSISLDV